MDEQYALYRLKDITKADGRLRSFGGGWGYVEFDARDPVDIELDGTYTLEHLQILVWWMELHSKRKGE